MSTVVVTLAIGYEKWITDMVRLNREEMCSAQGLEYRFHDRPLLENDWPPAWHKIPAIMQVLYSGNNALWIDADAAIIDRIPVEDLKDNIACAKDHNGWNIGIWYIPSNCRWVMPMMMEVGVLYPQVKYSGWWEQTAFHLLDENGRLPKIDQLDLKTWNTPEGTAIRHWTVPSERHKKMKLFLDSMKG